MKKNALLLILIFTVTAFFAPGNLFAQKTTEPFNGTNLSNWNFVIQNNAAPASEVFMVKDGVIHITGAPLGYMYTKEKYGNCLLHVEWRWDEGESNSGVFILIEDPTNPFPNGIECQLAAGKAGDLVMLGGSNLEEFVLNPGETRPAFPIISKKNPSSEKEAGEWNEADIYVIDGVISIYINGQYQNTGSNRVKFGHVGLQSEGKAVQFRNIQITRLEA